MVFVRGGVRTTFFPPIARYFTPTSRLCSWRKGISDEEFPLLGGIVYLGKSEGWGFGE